MICVSINVMQSAALTTFDGLVMWWKMRSPAQMLMTSVFPIQSLLYKLEHKVLPPKIIKSGDLYFVKLLMLAVRANLRPWLEVLQSVDVIRGFP